MCFEDVCGVVDGDWDDRAFCFGGDFEASFMEWKYVCLVCISVSGSFREDADGNAGFYFSTAVRMVFRPCLMSFLSRKRQ